MTIINHDPPDPEDPAENATAMMADVSVWTATDWRRMLDASAAGATVDGLLRVNAPRTWIGEALAAFDQSIGEAAMRRDFSATPELWVSRAAAAAAIASAEQQRVANLIAWKQLRQAATTSALPSAGDSISEEIERSLGITDGGAS